MKQDTSHIDPQLQPLLDALRHHGRNQRRQQALSEKIDQLAGLSTSSFSEQSRCKQSRWIWAAVSAAAVCLVLLILGTSSPSSDSPTTIGLVAETQFPNEISQSAMKVDLPLVSSAQQSSHPQIAPQMEATSSAATIFPDVACRIPDTLSPLDVAVVDLSQVADNHPDTNPVSEQSESQKPQVFIRQSTCLVAQSNSKKTRRSSESPITFLAMSSAENEGNSNNTFLIKEF